MTRTVIEHLDVLLTVDADDRVVRDARVVIDDGVLVEVGPSSAGGHLAGDELATTIVDGRGKLAMPGLVNLHTHLPMALLRGIAEDVDLQGFLARVWAAEAAVMDPATVELGATLGAIESLLGGCTTQLDMYFHHEAAHRGAVAAGARHVGGPVFFDFPGPDDLEWEQRLDGLRAWPAAIAELGGPQVPVAAHPHSTYTVSVAHLAEVADVLACLGAARTVLNTHVSENAAENADVRARLHASPTELIERAGWLGRGCPVVFAHGVHISVADRARLAGRATVAHCPGSNLKLASGALDWTGLAAADVRCGLGTDGCSSSNDLDMWTAMRTAALLARLTSGDPAAASATSILRAATIDGAAAIGMADLIGSLEIGKRADLILLDLDQPHLCPVNDVSALAVFAAGRGDVTDVWVDGRRVVSGRSVTTLDQAALLADCRQRGQAAWRAVQAIA